MQLHPWLISSWPIIECASDDVPRLTADLQHLGTVVSADNDEFGRLLGHTLWGIADSEIGLAWDWTETMDGVFALSDPMSVLSNIQFCDTSGLRLSDSVKSLYLNRIANGLAWQAHVAKVTQHARETKPWSSRVHGPKNVRFRPSELGGLTTRW